jgi:ribose transport system substrate-binding protein
MLALTLPGGCQREKKKVIAVVPKANSHLFWVSVQAGALAAGKEFNVEVEWNGPATETDYPRQIQILDSYISRRVDGICVAASETRALNGVLDRAARTGIPVVVFDSGVESENYVSFVATNNYEAGKMGGRAMGKLLGGKGKVALLMHMPGSGSTVDRERGFEDVIGKEFPGIQIVARQFGMSDRGKSMAAAENMMTANPDVDGMFCSTEPSSTGAALGIKGRQAVGRVKLIGFDSSDMMVEDMKAGVMQAMVVQDPFGLAREAVRLMVEKLNGRQVPKRVDLNARVVWKEDLEKPEVMRLLKPDPGKYLNQ